MSEQKTALEKACHRLSQRLVSEGIQDFAVSKQAAMPVGLQPAPTLNEALAQRMTRALLAREEELIGARAAHARAEEALTRAGAAADRLLSPGADLADRNRAASDVQQAARQSRAPVPEGFVTSATRDRLDELSQEVANASQPLETEPGPDRDPVDEPLPVPGQPLRRRRLPTPG